MRPLKVVSLQKAHSMDFVADCVLDLVSDFPKPVPTQTLVDECLKDKVSSPATTHKKLNQLKKLGLVEDFVHPEDKDRRKRFVQISKHGIAYLNKWEGATQA
jgi:Fe2+ or Zn2+ uptake regulation protein